MAKGVQLSFTASVRLNGSGAGTAQAAPTTTPTEVWNPTVISVQVSSNTNEATCQIYVGPQPQQNWFVDATFSGSTGDSTDKAAGNLVRQGNSVWAVWTGGDPGATATVSISGTRDT